MELPRYDAEGAPAGVKLAADHGGGPAGVVDGTMDRELRSGVDGDELSLGASNRFGILVRCAVGTGKVGAEVTELT